MDPSSIEAAKDDETDREVSQKLRNDMAVYEDFFGAPEAKKLSSFIGKAKNYDAIFFVGGHGPMFDLAKDTSCADLIMEFNKCNRIVAAVCHGPAALTHPKLKPFMKDAKVTGFSNSEEKAVGQVEVVPFSLEDKLQEMTGGYEKGDDWSEHVVIAKDGLLMTGQNPASAKKLAEEVRKAVFGELTV